MMSSSDFSQHVQVILDALRDGLGAYVLRQYKVHYSGKQYLARLQEILGLDALEDEAQALEELDLSDWLNAIETEWDAIFGKRLGRRSRDGRRGPDLANARNYLFELRNARNRWAHPRRKNTYTVDDTYRLADTSTRLLKIIKSGPETEKTAAIRSQLGRLIYAVEDEISEDSASVDATHFDAVDDGRKAEDSANPPTSMLFENREATIDLSGEDLRKWNLKAGNLQSVNLSRVNLAGLDLTMANFRNATLSGAKLTKANLAGSVFSGANLSGATLRKARMESPLVSLFDGKNEEDWSSFEETDWWRLVGISVCNRKAFLDKGLYVPPNVDRFVLTDFSGTDLAGADMREVFFCDDIYGLFVDAINIIAIASFRNANLARADLSGAVLAMADFAYADLTDAKLDAADISMSSFAGANLTRVKLTNTVVHPWDDIAADFSGADFTHAILENTCFRDSIFKHAKLRFAACARSDFSGSDFQGADMSSCVMKNAVLVKANLDEVTFCGADLSSAAMAGTSLRCADFADAKLSGADLEQAQLLRANFTKANLTKANLQSADLQGAILYEAELREANLSGADMTGADLTDANLMEANLESAILKDAKVDEAKFRFSTKLPDGSFWTYDTDLSYFTS